MIIQSNIHNYEVKFEADFAFFDALKAQPNAVFVCDAQIAALYPSLLSGVASHRVMLIEAIEENKTLDKVQGVYRFLTPFPEKKKMHLISIGGGIIQDITGFVAQTLYRGVPWSFLPTTFLAQADSCVGSKTSLNFESYKNILGGFYPPNTIYMCPAFLDSLSDRDYYSGIGEVIKFLLLDDLQAPDIQAIEKLAKALYDRRNRIEAIRSSLAVKQRFIAEDEFDLGKRNLFNYGHCFGHALEATSHYAVPHGLAVVVGMMVANAVALGRGLISDEFFTDVNKRLFLPTLPITFQADHFGAEAIVECLKNDKKRVGKDLTMIIPSSDTIEAIKADDVTPLEVDNAIATVLPLLRVS
ncbi:hypothetical protein QTP81_05965 [Alteromonas sp. ASW11-36]|uniref:3-dehydroquinate synthase n=1 Tax=Alteromonas arenosi TaxID=3055817 RepID=A0ABT7SVE2_9ALTE|nr:AroB-related putative sugar phosphate phospholyase (cyclizing) [Alteromonas sp. ASW11-36]MDM7860135.1 hypothetical protein [Alteromonas sp. ASW11-36]